MDKLADGLQKLGEDDLLQVVQMVHDNKSPDSYTKNDVERKSQLPTPFSVPRLHQNCLSDRHGFSIPRRSEYPQRLHPFASVFCRRIVLPID
jgi:hypothetical protein